MQTSGFPLRSNLSFSHKADLSPIRTVTRCTLTGPTSQHSGASDPHQGSHPHPVHTKPQKHKETETETKKEGEGKGE